MEKNILVIIGSPKGKSGNSNSIACDLIDKLEKRGLNCSKAYIKNNEKLVDAVDRANIVILCAPIYENSVPGLVIKFFEDVYRDKESLKEKPRKFFVITNSGIPEVQANKSAINTCRLFAMNMNFIWLGGIAVTPGTLIDGKELEKTGKTYSRLREALDIIAENITEDKVISERVYKLMNKPMMQPFIYRFGGRVMQKPIIKKIGKDKYLSTPFEI